MTSADLIVFEKVRGLRITTNLNEIITSNPEQEQAQKQDQQQKATLAQKGDFFKFLSKENRRERRAKNPEKEALTL